MEDITSTWEMTSMTTGYLDSRRETVVHVGDTISTSREDKYTKDQMISEFPT